MAPGVWATGFTKSAVLSVFLKHVISSIVSFLKYYSNKVVLEIKIMVVILKLGQKFDVSVYHSVYENLLLLTI